MGAGGGGGAKINFKGTMSHLQAKKNEKVKFQLHLKDNTNLELP